LTDTELIHAVKNGNDIAFKELVLKYESRIASTVIGMLGKCPEAEDVGQETFIQFYRSLPNFRGESSVITYMTRIAINLSLNELKRRKRRAAFFKDKSEEYLANMADNNTNYNTDDQEIIHKGLKELEPKFRSVIVLRLIEGY
jgi:RNA polymerase sigma-70 factor (ECF subfamily)